MVTTANLLRYFKCEDNAANTTVVDSTGTANGTSANNTSTMSTAGVIGLGFDMNGTSDEIAIGSRLFDSSSQDYSFFCWINTSSVNNNKALISQLTGATSDRWTFGFDDTSGGKLRWFKGSPTLSQVSDIAVDDGNDHFIGFVRDSGTVTFYIDNVARGSFSDSRNFQNLNTLVCVQQPGFNWYSGLFDEASIWDRALSSQDRTDLWNGGAGLTYPFTTETVRLIKIAGTFVEKPILTKVGGTFIDKPIKIKVGGTFQDA